MTKKFYSVKEIAKMLGISTITVYRECKMKRLGSIRIGGRIRVLKEHIEKYIQEPLEKPISKKKSKTDSSKELVLGDNKELLSLSFLLIGLGLMGLCEADGKNITEELTMIKKKLRDLEI